MDAIEPLLDWYTGVRMAVWPTPHDVKGTYGNASIIGNNRAVFNIAGNKYRLILAINYDTNTGFVKFIGTHAEYDAIDAETIEFRP